MRHETHKGIRYSRFYYGEEETSRKLEISIGIEDDARGWYCPEHVIDPGVYELEEQGILETNFLEEELPDGEPN